jgi:hypothetical protein
MHRNSEDVRQAEGQKRVDRCLKLRIWLNGPAADLEPIVIC